MPMNFRFVARHATPVVPPPQNGSQTRSPFTVNRPMMSAKAATSCPHLWNRLSAPSVLVAVTTSLMCSFWFLPFTNQRIGFQFDFTLRPKTCVEAPGALVPQSRLLVPQLDHVSSSKEIH